MTFNPTVKMGEWFEDQLREEDAKRQYLEKKARGELPSQKSDFLKQNLFRPVNLSVTKDGWLHFGDVVMLVNLGGETRECTAISINADINSLPSPGIQAPCGISAGLYIKPCARTAFVISSVEGSVEGAALHYGQSFALKTTSGFAGGLYLTSDMKTFIKSAEKSGFHEVAVDDNDSFLSWWKIEHVDPQERFEHEGQPVPANGKVLIIHCKTNQALAVLGTHLLWTSFGKEHKVTAHTFLDSHKAEKDNNHWIVSTADPAGQGLVLLNRPQTEA